MHPKKRYTKTVLPEQVVTVLQNNFSDRDRPKAIKIASRIYSKYIKEAVPFDEYIPISKGYKEKVLGTKYHQTWTPVEHLLFDIEKYERYGKEVTYHFKDKSKSSTGRCQSFRFKQNLIYSGPESIEYPTTHSKTFDKDFIVQETVRLLSRLKLNLGSFKEVKEYVSDFVFNQVNSQGQTIPEQIRSNLKVNAEITDNRFKHGNRYYSVKTTLQSFPDRTLYQYTFGQRTKIVPTKDQLTKDEIVHRVVQNIVHVYSVQLDKLLNIRDRENIDCSRNDTNTRLDTNLTNSKSEFLSLLTLDGDYLTQFDLKNSQLTIFGHLLYLSILEFISKNPDNENVVQYKAIRPNGLFTYFFEPKFLARNSKSSFLISCLFSSLKRVLKDKIKDRDKNIKETYPQLCVQKGLSACKSSDNFCFLARIEDFIKSTQDGTVYEQIASLLYNTEKNQVTKDQRKAAKLATFELLFSSYYSESKIKDKLSEQMPIVTTLIDYTKQEIYNKRYRSEYENNSQAFKLKYGCSGHKQASNDLSILFSQIESEIFVDDILTKLLKRRIPAFSKHDSIICRQRDAKRVEQAILKRLDKFFGIGGYKLSKE